MRHRNHITEENTPATTLRGVTGTLESLTERLAADDAPAPTGGKHRRPGTHVVPAQRAPFEVVRFEPAPADPSLVAPAPVMPAPVMPAPVAPAPVLPIPAEPVLLAPAAPTPSAGTALKTSPDVRARQSVAAVPHLATWKASHVPRLVAGILLGGAVLGTAALALQFVRSPGSDSLVALVIGVVAVVLLWAAMIASTPQVVSLAGPILTVRSSDGSERFDLSDGLQAIDIVDHPGSSQWAVLLHRPDRTSLVLRRHHVVAEEFDPIVRHYRRIAEQTWSQRQARFSR